jgi:hypothetical protein
MEATDQIALGIPPDRRTAVGRAEVMVAAGGILTTSCKAINVQGGIRRREMNLALARLFFRHHTGSKLDPD